MMMIVVAAAYYEYRCPNEVVRLEVVLWYVFMAWLVSYEQKPSGPLERTEKKCVLNSRLQ